MGGVGESFIRSQSYVLTDGAQISIEVSYISLCPKSWFKLAYFQYARIAQGFILFC